MRVVHASSQSRWTLPRATVRDSRTARIERLGLLATSLVVALGLWLVSTQQVRSTTGCTPVAAPAAGQTPSVRPCLDLTRVTRAADVAPLLFMYTDPLERSAVAGALAERLTDPTAPAIDHVGSLAAVTLPASRIRGQRRFAVLNQRLDARSGATEIPVLSGADLARLKPSMIVRGPAAYTRTITLIAGLFMLSFWLTHGVRWWRGTTGDPILLPAVQLLGGLGLMTMTALRDPLRDTIIALPAAEGIAAGCLAWMAIGFAEFEQPSLRRTVLTPLVVAVLLAFALLTIGSGPTGSGAKVNLFGVQPVEAIRLLVVFSLAAYFARRWQFLRELSEPAVPASVHRHLPMPRWKDVRPLAITVGTLLTFFFLQKDLGPALVLSCVSLGLYGIARGRIGLVLGGFAALALGFVVGYALGFPATVAQRVVMWMDPWENAVPGGDQIAHGLWALATGGAAGLGPGVGDPQLIPAGHTDLVLAALGEDLGYVGVASALVVLGLIVWRMLSIAQRAPGDYTSFLAAGLTLALAAQAIVIVAGILGLLPLAGVVTPFMSFGRSSMLSNFVAVAVCCAIARRQGPARVPFVAPMGALRWTFAVAGGILLARAGFVQVVRADAVAAEANLTRQADGGYRYQYNPRLVAAGNRIPRGTIFDRSGLPLASSDRALLDTFARRYRQLGLDVECPVRETRCYPLGGLAFHLLGDAEHQLNWAARNTSFAEQTFDAQLRGFDDHVRTVKVRHPVSGEIIYAVKRDFSALLPLVRHKANPSHPDVRRILERNRDLQLTIDAQLQLLAARAVRRQAIAAGSGRGAAVVVDPAAGDLLASVSYPWPEARQLRGEVPTATPQLLDRARYGLYPPGSTFKLVTAVAALRNKPETQDTTFQCVRLGDGRVGGRVPGVGRVIRDDLQDKTPHGTLDLHKALVVSCNAYFANLAQKLGSKALAETAAAAQISIAPAPVDANLPRTLAFAGYGQGDVVASPLRMARVAAALAADGMLRDVIVMHPDTVPSTSAPPVSPGGGRTSGLPAAGAVPETGVRWLSPAGAALLRRDMRAVVTSGTGRALASHPVPIAGKTGTAEVDGERAHSWFVGFAPADAATPRIAFAVIVENAGYGGRVAAPLAGEIVSAAATTGLLKAPSTSTHAARGGTSAP